MQQLCKLLTTNIINSLCNIDNITELRLRRDKPLVFSFRNEKTVAKYIVRDEDIEYALAVATKNSVYAVGDSMVKGYLVYDGGIRLGICGEAVVDKGKVVAVKNVSSLVIRMPHSIEGCADGVMGLLQNYSNTILVSPPCCGKTTLLRDMVRYLSNKGKEILLIDERNEISATVYGKSTLNIGSHTDVLVGMPKLACYEGAVRCMNPEIIATDEIFGLGEVDCLLDCVRSGVKVLATVHSDSIDKVKSSPIYGKLNSVITNYVLLDNSPIGRISEIINS